MSSQAYIIEVGGNAAGIVVRQAGDALFHFHSAATPFNPLNGKTFANPRAAERAAYTHISRRQVAGAGTAGGAS